MLNYGFGARESPFGQYARTQYQQGQQQQQTKYKRRPDTRYEWKGPEDFMRFYAQNYKDIFEEMNEMFKKEGWVFNFHRYLYLLHI
jgi:hypothetical protein